MDDAPGATAHVGSPALHAQRIARGHLPDDVRIVEARHESMSSAAPAPWMNEPGGFDISDVRRNSAHTACDRFAIVLLRATLKSHSRVSKAGRPNVTDSNNDKRINFPMRVSVSLRAGVVLAIANV